MGSDSNGPDPTGEAVQMNRSTNGETSGEGAGLKATGSSKFLGMLPGRRGSSSKQEPGGGGDARAPAHDHVVTHDHVVMAHNDNSILTFDCQRFDPFSSYRDATCTEIVGHMSTKIFPPLGWMKTYTINTFKEDVIAGVTVGVMIIPQSMAYAIIAGLPAVYGLYSACIPLFVYGLMGSSRQLAVGPVAIVSLLVEASLSQHADKELEKEQYVQMAILLGFISGVVQLAMGVARMGFMVNFLSHAVISGFTSGAAVLIGMSQLAYVLGFKVKSKKQLDDQLEKTFDKIENIHWLTFLLAMFWIALLLTFKHLGKKYKKLKMLRPTGPLIVTVVGTLTTYIFRLDRRGLETIGSIESGLPSFDAGLAFEHWEKIIGSAVVCSFVGFMESIAIAKSLASKNHYDIDSNQELVGLGMANLLGSFFSTYPITGSFSRSAVNNDSGAKTSASGIITGCVVLMTLLFLTDLFTYLPNNVLAAIVLSAVSGLIDLTEARFLWKVSKKDFATWIVAFGGVLFLGVEIGVGIAVALSISFIIYETVRPHTAVLGRLPGTTVYRSTKQYTDAITEEGCVILRIDAPIYFANIAFVKDKLREYEEHSWGTHTSGRLGGAVHFVVLAMSPVHSIDSTGVHALRDIVQDYKSRGVQLVLANPNGNVMRALIASDVIKLIGNDWVFLRVDEAVNACRAALEAMNESKSMPPPNANKLGSAKRWQNAAMIASQREMNMSGRELETTPENGARLADVILQTMASEKKGKIGARLQGTPEENGHAYGGGGEGADDVEIGGGGVAGGEITVASHRISD